MMRSTTRKLTEYTTRMGHRLLRITGHQIKHRDHVELQKSWCRYLEKVEDKHTEKNFMGTDHLVLEQGHYKAVFRGKSKRTKDCDKGTPMFNNSKVKRSIMSTLKHARSA